MRLPLRGAIVVITGASSGIGRATAVAMAHEGAHLVLAARRAELLDEVAAECMSFGVRAISIPTDVGDDGAVQRLRDEALQTFGRIDVWINNASVLAFGNVVETPLSAYRRVFDTNFFGCLHGSRAALSVFHDQGEGRLINVGSLFGRMGSAHVSAYIASKHAVLGLTRTIQQETALQPNIHVGSVVPAGVDTPILQHAANYTGIRVRALYPLATPEHAAHVIVSMATHPKREVFVGGIGRVHDALQRVAPGTHDRITAWVTERSRQRAHPMPVTDGNVFFPMEEGRGASGGIRRPRVAARRALGVAAVAALIAGKKNPRRKA